MFTLTCQQFAHQLGFKEGLLAEASWWTITTFTHLCLSVPSHRLHFVTCTCVVWNESLLETCLWVHSCVKMFKGIRVSVSLVPSHVKVNIVGWLYVRRFALCRRCVYPITLTLPGIVSWLVDVDCVLDYVILVCAKFFLHSSRALVLRYCRCMHWNKETKMVSTFGSANGPFQDSLHLDWRKEWPHSLHPPYFLLPQFSPSILCSQKTLIRFIKVSQMEQKQFT